jgi:hypothetical protein
VSVRQDNQLLHLPAEGRRKRRKKTLMFFLRLLVNSSIESRLSKRAGCFLVTVVTSRVQIEGEHVADRSTEQRERNTG